MNHSHLQFGRFRYTLAQATRPLVMGILNVTPDSFSDGGQYISLDMALTHAEQMIMDGVDIIDIGGESSRPGARQLSDEEELGRVMPILYALRDCGRALSVDTTKPRVMREAIEAGADMINDINGFRSVDAVQAVSQSDVALCIMHMQGVPGTMQQKPAYEDVVAEVSAFLQERVAVLEQAGVERRRLCIDPGFGFGKTLQHNLALLHHLQQIGDTLGLPVLAGLSRKSMIGTITGKPVEQRLAGSLGAALAAAARGARIVRVHDVAETVDALRVWQAASHDNIHTMGRSSDPN
jgi:dihydropteroate synthase